MKTTTIDTSYNHLIDKIYENIDTDCFGVISDERITIENFLQYCGIEKIKDIQEYIKEKNDFWDDKTKDGRYWCDIASEWADNEVDIYNQDLFETAWQFSEWIEEALEEFGFDKKRGLIGVLQAGQYLFYSRLASEILSILFAISEKKIKSA